MLPYLPGIILISLYAYYSIKISLFFNYGWCPTILVFQFCYVRDDILLNQWNAVQYSPSGMEFLRKSRNQWLIRNSVFEPWQAIIYLQQNWDSWVPRVVDKTLSNLDAIKKGNVGSALLSLQDSNMIFWDMWVKKEDCISSKMNVNLLSNLIQHELKP